jgi:hypothetical protein
MGSMKSKRAWSPAEGPLAAPQQHVPAHTGVRGDGHTKRSEGGLWAPSEGPVRSDPGGPGGEPEGRPIDKPWHSPLDE